MLMNVCTFMFSRLAPYRDTFIYMFVPMHVLHIPVFVDFSVSLCLNFSVYIYPGPNKEEEGKGPGPTSNL